MSARAAVIMAAGHGTRMKSKVPKVLHKVGGRSLLDRMIDTVQAAGCERIHVIVGAHSPEVRQLVEGRLGPEAAVVQDPLPATVRDTNHLLPMADALRQMHFPSSPVEVAEARRRFGSW